MVRGEFPNRSRRVRGAHRLMLLCLSATMMVLWGQQQQAAAFETAVIEGAPSQLKPPQVEPPVSPPIEEPSNVSPVEKPQEPFNASPTENPSPASKTISTRLVIKLSERRVYVYRDNSVQVSYPIAVGKEGWETPVGTYQVMQMIKDPAWEHPWTGEIVEAGPDNPLGSRWIGFWTDGKDVIGFHGTPNEDSVGQAASHGCIRMFNRDVQALFEDVAIGTPVMVEP